jgi:hypothetical protein
VIRKASSYLYRGFPLSCPGNSRTIIASYRPTIPQDPDREIWKSGEAIGRTSGHGALGAHPKPVTTIEGFNPLALIELTTTQAKASRRRSRMGR